MTMNGITQIEARGNKQIFWSAVRLLIGGALGAAAYLVIAKIVMDQPTMACSPRLARSIIEATYFPVGILLGPILHLESRFYQPLQYGLASIPYAVLGALIALGAKKIVIFVAGFLTVFCICVSLVVWAFIISSICA
jgi:hypothetical protein